MHTFHDILRSSVEAVELFQIGDLMGYLVREPLGKRHHIIHSLQTPTQVSSRLVEESDMGSTEQ
jgi:hypothetical protein